MEENVSSEEEYNRSKKRISSLKTEADLYPFLSRALMRPLDAIDTCVLDLYLATNPEAPYLKKLLVLSRASTSPEISDRLLTAYLNAHPSIDSLVDFLPKANKTPNINILRPNLIEEVLAIPSSLEEYMLLLEKCGVFKQISLIPFFEWDEKLLEGLWQKKPSTAHCLEILRKHPRANERISLKILCYAALHMKTEEQKKEILDLLSKNFLLWRRLEKYKQLLWDHFFLPEVKRCLEEAGLPISLLNEKELIRLSPTFLRCFYLWLNLESGPKSFLQYKRADLRPAFVSHLLEIAEMACKNSDYLESCVRTIGDPPHIGLFPSIISGRINYLYIKKTFLEAQASSDLKFLLSFCLKKVYLRFIEEEAKSLWLNLPPPLIHFLDLELYLQSQFQELLDLPLAIFSIEAEISLPEEALQNIKNKLASLQTPSLLAKKILTSDDESSLLWIDSLKKVLEREKLEAITAGLIESLSKLPRDQLNVSSKSTAP